MEISHRSHLWRWCLLVPKPIHVNQFDGASRQVIYHCIIFPSLGTHSNQVNASTSVIHDKWYMYASTNTTNSFIAAFCTNNIFACECLHISNAEISLRKHKNRKEKKGENSLLRIESFKSYRTFIFGSFWMIPITSYVRLTPQRHRAIDKHTLQHLAQFALFVFAFLVDLQQQHFSFRLNTDT